MQAVDLPAQALQANKELEVAYTEPLEKWKDLWKQEHDKGRSLSIPIFVKAQPSYFEAMPRIMFVGQETHGWWTEHEGDKASLTSHEIMAYYERTWEWLVVKYHSSPYWQAIRKITQTLNLVGRPHSFLFTNIFPCDVDQKQAPLELHDHFRDWQILSKELSILAPSHVIFFCGREYYGNLKAYFGSWPDQNVSGTTPVVNYQPEGMPWKGIVTYHPAYFRRSNQWEALDDIIRFIQADSPVGTDPSTSSG